MESQAHMDWITCLAVGSESADGMSIVSGGHDQRVVLWRLSCDALARHHLHQLWVSSDHAANIRHVSIRVSRRSTLGVHRIRLIVFSYFALRLG